MWQPTPTCPCPSGVSRDIPVVRIKMPQFDDDLEKLHRIGKDYTGPSVPTAEKEEETSKAFVGPYVPMPYTFRLGCGPPQRGQHARSPPLWLLIDHTLAVIWCLFSPTKQTPLGVAQLEWALAFLSGIKNSDGTNPADIQVCIDAIKNRLFAQFVDAQEGYADKQIPCGLHICDPCYVAKSKTIRDSVASKGPLSTIREETSKAGLDAETQVQFICPNAVVEKPVPVSATINSMLKSHSPSVHQLFKAGSSTINKQSEETLSFPKPTALPSDLPFETTTSKDEVLEFLSKWRADQLERIEGEMTRLQSIEALIRNVDSATAIGKKGGN